MDIIVPVCDDNLAVNNWVQCQHCDYKTTKRINLRTHVKRHTDVCFHCKTKFPKTFDMKQHSKVHINRNGGTDKYRDLSRFNCVECQSEFPVKDDLKKHQFIHLNIKQFKCTLCGKSFKQPTGLYNHKKTHEKASIKCSACDKTFVSMTNYKKHQITHSTEKKFSCEECDKLFKRKADMKKHNTDIHTVNYTVFEEQTNYICEECHAVFKTNSRLKEHQIIHSNEKPFDLLTDVISLTTLSQI